MKKTVIILSVLALIAGSCNQATQNQSEVTNDEEVSVSSQTIEETIVNHNIEGIYRNSEETSCAIFLEIKKSGKGYSYSLSVDEQDELKGKVSVSDNGITLEGIAWVSNLGELKDGVIPEKDKGEPAFGVYFEWDNNSLIMQNYGNSMNYYQILNCEDKYIKLDFTTKKERKHE